MSTRCKHPDLQIDLLSSERSGDLLEPALAAHRAECGECQVISERIRRMASVWVADQVDEHLIAAAETRFLARERAVHEPKLFLGALPFAGLGAAVGLTLLVVARSFTPAPQARARTNATQVPPAMLEPGAPARAPAPEPGAPGAARTAVASVAGVPHVESPRGVMALTDGARLELREGETAQVSLANGESSMLRGPCVVEFWASATAVGGWRFAYPNAAASAAASAEVPRETAERAVPAAPAADAAGTANASPMGAEEMANPAFAPAWARAAEALRRDDFPTADSAFSELGHAPDAPTRDAARLARAQLWMAHGRGKDVAPVLQDLAASGATPLVRQRAAEFLAKSPQ